MKKKFQLEMMKIFILEVFFLNYVLIFVLFLLLILIFNNYFVQNMKNLSSNKFEESYLYKLCHKNTSSNIKLCIVFVAFIFFSKILMTINHIELRNEPSKHSEDKKRRSTTPKTNYEDIFGTGDNMKMRGHEETLEILRRWFLDPPSPLAYHLQEDVQNIQYNYFKTLSPSWMFINSVLMDFYRKRPPGFFVEAGALDGEYLSNTLQLERKLNWTGLLVEGDKNSYLKLKSKNRKSWSSPLCLATNPYPHEVIFTTFQQKTDSNWGDKGAARIQQNVSIYNLDGPGYASFSKVLCVPADYLLDAMNVTHVDFFSLDVEGVEIEVLKVFPFDRITVDMWAIEHTNINDPGIGPIITQFYISANHTYRYEDSELVAFMERKGYYFFDMFCAVISDYIFIRKESELFKELAVPENKVERSGVCLTKKHFEPKTRIESADLRDKRHWPTLKFST